MDTPLNRELLLENTCFGCGLENPAGLRIEVRRDPDAPGRLRAVFHPTSSMTGFPAITHGGAIYTSLDCLSTWVATLLGPNRSAAWLLRSASVTYHKPAPAGEPLSLEGWVKHQGGDWDPIVVATQARRGDGALCVEAEFKVIPLSLDRLKTVAGIDTVPANWRAFLGGAA